MRWKIERQLVLWGFLVAGVALAFAGWESYRNSARFAEAAEARAHSYDCILALDEVEHRLVDAETGQRGYLLTGDEAYLAPYRSAIRNLDQVTANLKEFTANDPDLQDRFQQLGRNIEGKLAELQETIDLRRHLGLSAAREVVVQGSGKHWMDEIRVVLEAMKNHEYEIRRLRTQEITDIGIRTRRTVIMGYLLALLLLSGGSVLLGRQLSERGRTQQSLEKSEKWLSTTLGSIGDAVIATDMNGAVAFMNPVAQSLTGWGLEEARGKSMDLVFDIINRETRRPVENPIKKVFREGKVVGLADHTILRSRNGKEFEIEDSAAPIRTDTGEGLGVVLVFRDITEIQQTREELDRYFALSVDMLCIAGVDGQFKRLNPAWQKVLGYSVDELLAKPYLDFVHPDDRQATIREVEKQSHGHQVISFENRYRCKDGSYKWFSWSATPVSDRGMVYAVARDVTEVKQEKAALRLSEERYRLLFESNPHPVWVYDLETLAILDVNAAAVGNYGYSREEFRSLTIKDIRPPEDVPAVLESIAESRSASEENRIWRHLKKDGTLFYADVTSHPLVYNGTPARLVVATDITERKQIEEALVRAKEEAERSNKFKDQFLSTMSHELRTPLNAVLGFSELLREERYGALNERQQRYLNHIHNGGSHLLRLINDILDLSRIEAGRLQLAVENVPVNICFSEVVDTLRPLADKKSQTLVLHRSLDLSVRADATRFKQILMNLLGNAVKFTPEGGRIELGVQSLGPMVRIDVRDSGPGIPVEEQQKIFEAFHRLRQSEKTSEGTGLGLAITRRLVELHGGELGIESEPGSGSCFYFTLPLVPTVLPEEAQARAQSRKGKPPRILVIEDDLAAAHLLESQLASAGYQVALCEQPSRAVELAAQLQPSAVTMDIVMKPVNGWELLANLKSDPRTAQIPVVVVTVVDQPSTGALLGADEYIVKPVEKTVLLAAIERCLNSRSPKGQSPRILVVEDDAPTREFVAEFLTRHGYVVSTVADGVEARAQVAASLPELVILDLILPQVSGFQLLSEWRHDSRTADLPVFVLTSKDLSLEEKDYLHAHAGALFHKNDSWQETLIRQLERALAAAAVEQS